MLLKTNCYHFIEELRISLSWRKFLNVLLSDNIKIVVDKDAAGNPVQSKEVKVRYAKFLNSLEEEFIARLTEENRIFTEKLKENPG